MTRRGAAQVPDPDPSVAASAQPQQTSIGSERSLRRSAFGALWGSGVFAAASALSNFEYFLTVLNWFGVGSYSQGPEILYEAAEVVRLILGIGAYITLVLWMTRIRGVMVALGHNVPPGWELWASWVIPVYAFYGPYRIMASITRQADVKGALRVWWTLWLLSLAVVPAILLIRVSFLGLLLLPPLQGVLFCGSYWALSIVIRKTTRALGREAFARSLWNGASQGLQNSSNQADNALPPLRF